MGLGRIAASDLLDRLHALVKAEQRRGNLKPTVLPVGVAAIDGKNVATLRWRTLCRVLRLVKLELRRCMHDPVPKVGAWLGSVVQGHI